MNSLRGDVEKHLTRADIAEAPGPQVDVVQLRQLVHLQVSKTDGILSSVMGYKRIHRCKELGGSFDRWLGCGVVVGVGEIKAFHLRSKLLHRSGSAQKQHLQLPIFLFFSPSLHFFFKLKGYDVFNVEIKI